MNNLCHHASQIYLNDSRGIESDLCQYEFNRLKIRFNQLLLSTFSTFAKRTHTIKLSAAMTGFVWITAFLLYSARSCWDLEGVFWIIRDKTLRRRDVLHSAWSKSFVGFVSECAIYIFQIVVRNERAVKVNILLGFKSPRFIGGIRRVCNEGREVCIFECASWVGCLKYLVKNCVFLD